MSVAIPQTSAGQQLTPQIRWLVNGPIDLIIGCGLWSVPWLLASNWLSTANVISLSFMFYFLAVFCNNPHYMATIHRAYGTPSDFRKYRFFTIYVTVFLVLTAALTHFSPVLLPVLFTVYLTWSPWHYTGQNFGIAMMFARRGGLTPHRHERNLLYTAFLASYLMWFFAIHSMFTSNPYLLTLGIPENIAQIGKYLSAAVFLAAGGYTLFMWVRRAGLKLMLPAMTLLSTQFFWFVFPLFLQIYEGEPSSAIYFSSGALAFMHCAQYLWVTQHYAHKEFDERNNGGRRWNPWVYYTTLVVGGIALFVPGPWLVSYTFNYNLVDSYLIFVALINLHHFILDGAIWKLRDNRIAALLLGNAPKHKEEAVNRPDGTLDQALRWITSGQTPARAVRYTFAVALVGIAALDQMQFFWTRDGATPAEVQRATQLNPHDTRTALQRALQLAESGDKNAAIGVLEEALDARGYAPKVRRMLGTMLVETNQLDKAKTTYADVESMVRPDIPTLINTGVLAANSGDQEGARERFEKALEADPERADIHLNLAELYFSEEKFGKAIEHYNEYFARKKGSEPGPAELAQMSGASMRMGQALIEMGTPREAFEVFRLTRQLAQSANDRDTEALALARMADLQRKNRDFAGAVAVYRAAIQTATAAQNDNLRGLLLYDYATLLLEARGMREEALAVLLEVREELDTEAEEGLGKNITQMIETIETESGITAASIQGEQDRIYQEAMVFQP